MDQAIMPLPQREIAPLHGYAKNSYEKEHPCSSTIEDPVMSSRFLNNHQIATVQYFVAPLRSSPIGQALTAPRKETYDYLRNATMTAASAVLLFCEFGVHYFAKHESTQRLPWSSAERAILVFLVSTFCYRAAMNLVEARQSSFLLLLPELLTMFSLFLGLLHALRLASFCLIGGSMYLMIFALTSTLDKFAAMNDKMALEVDEAVQRSRSV